MVTRRALLWRSRVRNVVMDTDAADFTGKVAGLARQLCNAGRVSAISCVGVGTGSKHWTEEDLKKLELGVVGSFARGCHDAGITQFCLLSAVGSKATSRWKFVRVMGMKENTVRDVGFARLAIFRPGIIAGLGQLVRKAGTRTIWEHRSANAGAFHCRGSYPARQRLW